MKVLKPLFYSALAGLILTSCKTSIVAIPVPNGTEIAINMSAKKGKYSDVELNTWSHLDLEKDSIPGMSIAKAYRFLEGKKGVTVIVAIADSGLDIEHKDLKDVAWTNPKEIAGNNNDDDNNGYVDDIHGWNFLGNESGIIVNADQLEITRIVKSGMVKFGDKKASEIEEKNKTEFEDFVKIKEDFTKVSEAKKSELANLEKTAQRLIQIESNFKSVRKLVGKETYTIADLKAIKTENPEEAAQISDIIGLLNNGASEKGIIEYKKGFLNYKDAQEKAKSYDLNFNARQSLGDDLYDITDSNYGNNNVIGSKDLESHGTHVAGIVGASRNNSNGVNGVANNVKIMAVRVVPDGDEHDKDVALGIRYAVDNGAKIINTSFGKKYSPNKEWVYEAIKYAAKKDVLIVNAAGNDGKNIDVEKTFPNDSNDLVNEISDNVLTVGAMLYHYDERLPANFSNYGKMNVDVFAPGVEIYATVPKDKYKAMSGTSMAAPSAAGVAALVRSYYPQLSASQVKHILMNSGIKVDFNVIKPGSKSRENPSGEKVPFSDLSVSGRIVNAYNALKMADKIVNGK
ncbi:MAG: Thermophilic serine proteinase [Polaribacter sp. SA4-10]|nr:MAG: Thermophilic serine proteinase [Polaribacter sp. SA4-10]|tara:strand:+ start:927 stop:2639 length:1713 start_codon:yes stop_codon:yes gene_type:complete